MLCFSLLNDFFDLVMTTQAEFAKWFVEKFTLCFLVRVVTVCAIVLNWWVDIFFICSRGIMTLQTEG